MTADLATLPPANPDQSPVLIKGSWEQLLQEAQQLAANQNDEAIPIYEKLVQRLSKFSTAQRMANNERLQQVFLHAALQLQSYLTLRERYDDALSTLAQAQELTNEEEDQAAIAYQSVLVLLMANRQEEAFAKLRAKATEPGADISDWGALVMQYFRHGKLDAAEQAIEDAVAWMNAQGELDEETTADNKGYMADLRADLAIERGDWAAAEAHYATAVEQNTMYKDNVHLFYMRLMHKGQHERALPYIQRDQKHPIRSGFWHGVALFRQGQTTEAQEQWQKVLKLDPKETKENSFSEYVLTHYYLGDPERVGLGNTLQVIRESRRYDWQTLFLAGLGWALQGRLDNAETNLQVAINQRRMAGQGKVLPNTVWLYCVDLLDEAGQTQLAKYFETEPVGM